MTARPQPVARALRHTSAALAATALALFVSDARADVSSWLSAGFGVASIRWNGDPAAQRSYAMPLDLGVGTAPSHPIIVGFGGRFTPYFGHGSEWAAYARVATQGYVVGDFGLALDAGGYARAAGGHSTGGVGSLNVGLPWGFIVTGTYEQGAFDSKTLSAVVGIDFLRLTVFRLSGESTWPNVMPAWRRE